LKERGRAAAAFAVTRLIEKEETRMNKMKFIVALVAGLTLVFLGRGSFAQIALPNSQALGAPITVCATYERTGLDLSEASGLIAQRVYSPLGGELGQIEDLMIDRTDGHIPLVILSGVQGFGAEFVAAPFSALERTGENTLQLNFGDQYPPIPSSYYEDPYAYKLEENRSIVGLSTIPSKIDPLWADSVYEFYRQTPYWTEGKTPHPDIMSYQTARVPILESFLMKKTAPVLAGTTLHSKSGKAEARIDDLLIDSKDARVAFLVLDKVPGRGDAQVAVPFDQMSMIGNAFVLNSTGDRLAAAPRFDQHTDMNNLKWAENVYKFFGERPCWTE
jgi:sporulation protein YlmC with PRC-barrel domain